MADRFISFTCVYTKESASRLLARGVIDGMMHPSGLLHDA